MTKIHCKILVYIGKDSFNKNEFYEQEIREVALFHFKLMVVTSSPSVCILYGYSYSICISLYTDIIQFASAFCEGQFCCSLAIGGVMVWCVSPD